MLREAPDGPVVTMIIKNTASPSPLADHKCVSKANQDKPNLNLEMTCHILSLIKSVCFKPQFWGGWLSNHGQVEGNARGDS